MEKFIFLATVKDRLTELNLPQEAVNKHVKIFENCFKGKSADDIDKIINGAGGIDGIIRSIYNLESAKNNLKPFPAKSIDKTNNSLPTDKVTSSNGNTTYNNESVCVAPKKDVDQADENALSLQNNIQSNAERETDQNSTTIEITKSPNIEKHIREAEELSDTLERTIITSNTNSASDVEFSGELSDYDFKNFFAEKLSVPEEWVKTLRDKLSPKTYKSTLPLAFLADALLFIIVFALFILLLASAVILSVAYIALLVAGLTFSVIAIGYGIYMSFKTLPIGLYEIGIGIISLGITMLTCILLYNYVKRLVPFIFMELKKLFMLCVRLTKRYFGKTVKEEI